MGFKENLKSELIFQNMLVKELAVKTGISKRTLDNYLRKNACDPPVSSAVKIAKALGVSVEYLVSGDKSIDNHMQNDLHHINVKLQNLLPAQRLIVQDLINSINSHLN